jgi:Arc/MetJ-type ribon-helix-helix transcriptional regulator
MKFQVPARISVQSKIATPCKTRTFAVYATVPAPTVPAVWGKVSAEATARVCGADGTAADVTAIAAAAAAFSEDPDMTQADENGGWHGRGHDGMHRRRFGGPGDETGEPGGRGTTRVQLELPPQAMERLQRLKETSEAASYAEVVRNALKVLEALIEERDKGSEILLKRANGETVAYRIF